MTEVKIFPFTPEWNAWLAYHRGSKTEARMLACLGDSKSGRPTQPFPAPSRFPLEAPRADRVTEARPAPARVLPERRGIGDGDLDGAAGRLLAKAARDAIAEKETKTRSKKLSKAESAREAALAAAAQNQRPNIDDDNPHLGVIAVPDPTEAEILQRVGKGPPMRTTNKKAKPRLRVVSLRDDPVGVMAKRGQLGGGETRDIRLAAAREWQRLHERAELSNLRGLDPAFEHVDGGTVGVVDSADRIDAIKKLGELSRVLGIRSENLVRRVLAEKRTLRDAAAIDGILGASKKHDEKVLEGYSQRFRDSLDDLAGAFHLNDSATGKGPRRELDYFDGLGRSAKNPALHRAIGLAKVPDYTLRDEGLDRPVLKLTPAVDKGGPLES